MKFQHKLKLIFSGFSATVIVLSLFSDFSVATCSVFIRWRAKLPLGAYSRNLWFKLLE